MRKDLLTSLIAVVVLTVFFGLVYPLAMTGIAQVVFPGKANGSKVSVDGKVVGSSLIGQSFSKPVIGKNGKPMLDAEGEEVLAPTRPTSSRGPRRPATRPTSPTSATSAPTASKRAKRCGKTSPPTWRWRSRSTTASGQGPGPGRRGHRIGLRSRPPHLAGQRLDPGAPHRRRPPPSLAEVDSLISDHTDGRFLGLLGEPGVNVLQLNIALDKEAPLR